VKNIILTSYFNTLPDPQRSNYWEGDSIEIMQPLYDSVKNLGLSMIIFHDHLTECFKQKYTTDKITFKEYHPVYNILTERFYCYLEHLKVNRYDKVLCLDCSDTEVYRDPFPLIKDKVLIGSEKGKIGKSVFMHNWFSRAYGKTYYPDNNPLNCGILGGKYYMMLKLLTLFEKETLPMRGNVDMAVFNKLIYDGVEYTTGYPLHTEFWKEEGPDSGCYIKHK